MMDRRTFFTSLSAVAVNPCALAAAPVEYGSVYSYTRDGFDDAARMLVERIEIVARIKGKRVLSREYVHIPATLGQCGYVGARYWL